MSPVTSIDTATSRVPPNPGNPIGIKDYEWALSRFTAPEWDVKTIAFEENDHRDSGPTVLTGVLDHPTGSHIQCLPFDPSEHYRDQTLYRYHRVRYHDSGSNSNRYVTVANPHSDLCVPFDPLANRDTHPYDDAVESVIFHQQSEVHSADKTLAEAAAETDRDYHIDTKHSVLIAIFAAAQRITQKEGQQSGLGDYAVDGS